MKRLSNSWKLAKSSLAVLKADKKLAAIPVISFLVMLVVITAFGGAVYFSLSDTATHTTTTAADDANLQATPLTFVVGAAGYLVVTFFVTYFAAVLVSGAYQHLTGGKPTFGSAFKQANSNLGAIFGWAMLTGTVGLILQAIENRVGFLGQIVTNAVGAAWRIVTWLAVPVIVVERTGPLKSLKRAASLFKQTWGENLIAQGGFAILGFLLVLPILAVAVAVTTAIPVLGIAIGVVGIGVVAVVLSTLNGIFRAALYMYASTQQIPEYFEQQELANAFAQKTGRSGI